jgi:hypothetical protein
MLSIEGERIMRRTIASVVVLFGVSLASAESLTSAAPHEYTEREREFVQIERDYCTAQINRDADFLRRTLADDYMQIGSRGTLQTKADVLAGLRDTTNVLVACDQSDVRVRLYGAAAVVTGLTSATGVYRGTPFERRRVLWTDTFIRSDGVWRLVATQSTAAAPVSQN